MQIKKLGIVLVNYKSIDETIDFCIHELGKIQEEFILVIVNNSSDRKTDEKIAEALNAKIIIQIPKEDTYNIIHNNNRFVISVKENLGYAKGNNLGVNFLISYFVDIEYFLITNNDLIIYNENIIEVLIERMKTDNKIGLIGPKIIGLDGKDQSPHRELSFSQLMILPKLFYPFGSLLYRLNLIKTEIIQNAEEGFYHRIMGSFMIFSKECFIEINGFDEATFLYAEELIISERMRRKGYGCYFTPSVKVLHNHGNVTRKSFNNEQISDIYTTSLLYYFKKYRNISNFSILCFKIALFLFNNLYIELKKFFK